MGVYNEDNKSKERRLCKREEGLYVGRSDHARPNGT